MSLDLAKVLAKEKEERELGDDDVMVDIDQERAGERKNPPGRAICIQCESFLIKGWFLKLRQDSVIRRR